MAWCQKEPDHHQQPCGLKGNYLEKEHKMSNGWTLAVVGFGNLSVSLSSAGSNYHCHKDPWAMNCWLFSDNWTYCIKCYCCEETDPSITRKLTGRRPHNLPRTCIAIYTCRICFNSVTVKSAWLFLMAWFLFICRHRDDLGRSVDNIWINANPNCYPWNI